LPVKGYAWRWPLGIAAFLLSIPFILYSLFACVALVMVIRHGTDPSFQSIAELGSRGAVYRVYRTDGGAATSFGIVLRREQLLVPGVKLVSVVQNFYPAGNATLKRLPSGFFRLSVDAYGEGTKAEVFEFNPDG